MSGFWVALTKDGLRRERDGEEEAFVPAEVFELLGVWHSTVIGIDPDYTLGDLFSLLRGVDGIERLRPMLACDVAAFLAEAEREPDKPDEGEMRYVEVHNLVDLTAYQEDPDNPDEPTRWVDDDEAEECDAVADALHGLIGETQPPLLYDVTRDDPVTGLPVHRRILRGVRNGRWVGPYHLDRTFQGWGRWEEPHPGFFAAHPEIDPAAFEGGFALELTPVNELVHLPLRYNAAVAFPDGRPGQTAALLEDRITITFGELVHAVFWELGFLGSPEHRDEKREMLDARLADLHEALAEEEGDGEPWR